MSKDEQVLVQIGSLKMKVQIQNLRIIKDIEPKTKKYFTKLPKIDKTEMQKRNKCNRNECRRSQICS